jgi:hypothetical protein
MNVFVDRMLRAARLDVRLFEEVEREPATQMQALGVVVLASLAFGIGTGAAVGFGGLVLGTIGAVIGWYVWAFITYVIGTRLLPEPQTRADHGELLRTIGFANAPGLISVLGIVPGLRGIAIPIAQIWMLVAGVVAIRTALDYRSTLRAVGVVVIGWIVRAVLLFVIFALLGGRG